MDFRKLASAEASALVRRLVASSTEQSARELKSLRHTIDAAVQSLEAALHAQPAIDEDIDSLVERLAAVADAETEAASERAAAEAAADAQADAQALIERTTAEAQASVERATAEAEAAIEDMQASVKAEADKAAALRAQLKEESEKRDGLRAALKEATDKAVALETSLKTETERAATLRTTLKDETAKRDALRASLKELTEKAHALEGEVEKANQLKTALKAEQDQTAALRHQLANAGTARAVAEAARKTAETAAQKSAAQKAELEKELQAARYQIEQVRAAGADAERDAEAGRGAAARIVTLETMHADAVSRIAALETTHAEDEARIAELEAATNEMVERARAVREQAMALVSQPLDRLRDGVEKLSAATDVDDVLGALVDALSGEFARVAAFRMNVNSLEATHHTGFDGDRDISKIAVPLSLDSPIAEAARSGAVQQLSGDDLTDNEPSMFGGTPTLVVALPVVAGDEVLAVLYADNSDETTTELTTAERRVKFSEVLLAVAGPLLTRLSTEDTAVSEFRDYAIQLVKDLESVYTADIESGMPRKEVRTRLQHNLDYARRVFKQRVEPKGPRAAGLLDRQLVIAVSEKNPAPFAADLAAIAGIDVKLRTGKRSAKAS